LNAQPHNQFGFKPLTEQDLLFKLEWFCEPEINKWYAKNKVWDLTAIKEWYLPRLQGIENIPSFIVYYQHIPIGFIQYYSLAEYLPDGMDTQDYDTHQLFKYCDPNQLIGIDMYINNAARTHYGKGCGSALLLEFIRTQINVPFKHLLLDPAAQNIPAIKCYEKCGFNYFCSTYKTDNTEVWIMINL
jgi:aminoglycoside 6'-N-acetyltransferase